MNMPEKFSGVLTPVITPFKEDFSPDSKRLLKQCKWMLSHNVGLAVFGTNSEANSLSASEKMMLMDNLIDGGIDPNRMMPGTGCCSLADTVELTKHALNLEINGTLMLPPFYYKNVSDDGLYASYSEIIHQVGNSKLQIYLYHIPAVSNIPLSIDLIERLIKDYPKTIVGIKDSSGDWNNTKRMLNSGWDDFRIFVGAETFLLNNMRNGGAGCISATANVNPVAIKSLFENWDSDQAVKLQEDLNKVRDVFLSFPMIPALKAAAGLYNQDPKWFLVRPPLESLNSSQIDKLYLALKKINFVMPGLNRL